MAPILLLMMVTEIQEIPPIHQKLYGVMTPAGNTPAISTGNDVTVNVNDALDMQKESLFRAKTAPDS